MIKIPSQDITITEVGDGLTLVHVADRHTQVGIFGIAVRAGSRDDPKGYYGQAHFVEHMLFKGTTKRSATQIINRMEAVGGELNAYTTEEETVVYSVFPGANPARAAELIADIAANSDFPESELEMEREVIADEINSYLDVPSEVIYDDLQETVFATGTIGHNILGNNQNIDNITSATCRQWLERWYVPGNMLVFYSGSMSVARTAACVERYFGGFRRRPVPPHPADGAAAERSCESKSCACSVNQAHVAIGSPVPGLDSPDRHAIVLLTNILGGPGMNSLLNVALRERRGLVYTVEASTSFLTDCGLFTIYFGCDRHDLRTCRRLTYNILKKVADGYITESMLERAKKQYLGQWLIACENRENAVLSVARSVLLTGGVMSREEVCASIMAVTADDIRRVASQMVFTEVVYERDLPSTPAS